MDVTSTYDPITKRYRTIASDEVPAMAVKNFMKTNPGSCLLLSEVYNPLSLLIDKIADRTLLIETQTKLDDKLRKLFGRDFLGSLMVLKEGKTRIKVQFSFTVLEVVI